jgi:hypothetical protein
MCEGHPERQEKQQRLQKLILHGLANLEGEMSTCV